MAPRLRGPAGLFNGYGRLYLDGAQLEFAAAESGPPLLLQIVHQQRELAGQAIDRVEQSGDRLFLSSIGYSRRLRSETSTWGSHGNFLFGTPPARLANRLILFLATRLVAGPGGLAISGRRGG